MRSPSPWNPSVRERGKGTHTRHKARKGQEIRKSQGFMIYDWSTFIWSDVSTFWPGRFRDTLSVELWVEVA